MNKKKGMKIMENNEKTFSNIFNDNGIFSFFTFSKGILNPFVNFLIFKTLKGVKDESKRTN